MQGCQRIRGAIPETRQRVLPPGYNVVEFVRVPVCGEDFCERCGDCLSCYGHEGCALNDFGPHQWFIEPEEKK